jgi:hypothetical protein
VKAALGVWILTLLAAEPPSEEDIRVDVERWPPQALVQARIDFAQARRAYVRDRQRWDVLNRGGLEEEERELDRAILAWQKARKAREDLNDGCSDLSAISLGELRAMLSEDDYRAGRLPPIPDMAKFTWAD